MQDFKKLKVWEKAHKFTLQVYSISKNFPVEERYGLTSQIRRASTSIPLNIAEGCGRYTTKDKVNFFQIALGSTQEVEYILVLTKDLQFIHQNEFDSANKEIQEVKAC